MTGEQSKEGSIDPSGVLKRARERQHHVDYHEAEYPDFVPVTQRVAALAMAVFALASTAQPLEEDAVLPPRPPSAARPTDAELYDPDTDVDELYDSDTSVDELYDPDANVDELYDPGDQLIKERMKRLLDEWPKDDQHVVPKGVMKMRKGAAEAHVLSIEERKKSQTAQESIDRMSHSEDGSSSPDPPKGRLLRRVFRL